MESHAHRADGSDDWTATGRRAKPSPSSISLLPTRWITRSTTAACFGWASSSTQSAATRRYLGELGAELRSIGESFSLTPREVRDRLRQLSDNVIRRREEEERIESAQGELFGLGQVVADWRQEVEDAESPWMFPIAIRRCVNLYLQKLFESPERDFFGGSGPVRTLRLGADAKRELLARRDVRGRRTGPRFTRWEDWLRGASSRLPVTFRQEAARESDDVVHLRCHALARSAGRRIPYRGRRGAVCRTNTRTRHGPESDRSCG